MLQYTNIIPTLRQIANVRIVKEIIEKPELISEIQNYLEKYSFIPFEFLNSEDFFENLCKTFELCLTQINTPDDYVPKILCYAEAMMKELLQWISYHGKFLKVHHDWTQYITILEWNFIGKIQYQDTFHNILCYNENLSIELKFILSCLNYQHEFTNYFIAQSPKFEPLIIRRKFAIVLLLWHDLVNKLNDIDYFDKAINDEIFYEYKWELKTFREQIHMIQLMSKNKNKNIIHFWYRLNRKIQKRMITSFPIDAAYEVFDNIIYIDFYDFWLREYCKSINNEYYWKIFYYLWQRLCISHKGIRKWRRPYYEKFFLGVWKSGGQQQKNFLMRHGEFPYMIYELHKHSSVLTQLVFEEASLVQFTGIILSWYGKKLVDLLLHEGNEKILCTMIGRHNFFLPLLKSKGNIDKCYKFIENVLPLYEELSKQKLKP